jgi:hypothetical protein
LRTAAAKKRNNPKGSSAKAKEKVRKKKRNQTNPNKNYNKILNLIFVPGTQSVIPTIPYSLQPP